MSHHTRIVRDPTICAGQPVIRGTRVLVRVILGHLAHGERLDTILRNFPSLTEEDLRAVIAFSAAAAGEDLTAPLPLPPAKSTWHEAQARTSDHLIGRRAPVVLCGKVRPTILSHGPTRSATATFCSALASMTLPSLPAPLVPLFSPACLPS